MADTRIKAIFRCVDDFLILCNTNVEGARNEHRKTVMRCFQESCAELFFTPKLTVEKSIKFLDLVLEFQVELCLLEV